MTNRFYGEDGTIHHTGYVDVETRDGEVVAVWFRCQTLPFKQTEVDQSRADEMKKALSSNPAPEIRGFRLKI